MKRILILEDDIELNQGIKYTLEKEGYHVCSAYSYAEGEKAIKNGTFDIVILDVNLPDGDGFMFCKWLRIHYKTFILFLTARDLEEDVLKGYELGADDYVTKPFSMKILLKKIAVILLRENKISNTYEDNFLKIDFNAGTVKINEKESSITPTEYKILKKFVEHKGQLLTYSLLLDSLWDEGVELMDKHALAVNINRLRRKIEDEEHSYISNVYGMGYLWK